MAEPDRRAIDLAGGVDVPICVIPAAAAPDHNDRRAGANAERWFRSLGARQVKTLPLVDRDSAGDPEIAAELRLARLIYLLGGFPGYLGRSLQGSPSWEAVLEAYAGGAVVGGSSAGAMVLCANFYDPFESQTLEGLGLVQNACAVPHHDTGGDRYARLLAEALPGAVVIGIDERTGLMDDAPSGGWTVYGQGAVTLYRGGQVEVRHQGEALTLEMDEANWLAQDYG